MIVIVYDEHCDLFGTLIQCFRTLALLVRVVLAKYVATAFFASGKGGVCDVALVWSDQQRLGSVSRFILRNCSTCAARMVESM